MFNCIFVSAKEPIRYSRSRLLILIQLSLKTWLSLREPFDLLSLVIWRRILFDICGVAFRLLLIAVAFCASRGVRLFTSCLQIPTEGFGLKRISICNCSFALFCLPKPCSSSLPFSHKSNHLSWPARITVVNALQRRSQQKICRGTSVSDA